MPGKEPLCFTAELWLRFRINLIIIRTLLTASMPAHVVVGLFCLRNFRV